MLEAAQQASKFLTNRNRTDLDNDEILVLAVLKLIEIIGEAASAVSPELKYKYKEIPWKQIISVRNRLIRGYFDINYDILWGIANHDLPPLIKNLEKILSEFKD